MKCPSLLMVALFLLLKQADGQNIINLQKSDTIIHPVISGDNIKIQTGVKLSIELINAGKTIKDLEIKVLFTLPRAAEKLNPTLKTEKIKISSTEWPAKGSKTITKIVFIETSAVTDFGSDIYGYLTLDNAGESADLKFAPCADCNAQVTFTRNGTYDPAKSFWMEVGANFDLVDGLQPNNFFSGVFFYKKDIRNLSQKGKEARNKNLGVFAGVYESKSISNNSLSDSNYVQYNDRSAFRLNRHDSIPVFRDSGNLAATTVVRNVSLFFSPQLRLTNGLANEDGFHVFLSLWMELQWQRVKTEFNYSGLKRIDTVYLPASVVSSYKTTKMETDFRSHYFGIGLPVFFKEGNTNLFFNPTFGMSNQPEFNLQKTGSAIPAHFSQNWNPFFIFQFRLNEEKYGFAFTGEVRGIIKKNNAPIVALALSKKFDITKFLEFK